ncbi:hypothetical protein CRM22_002304 [Opisthorchis felineus]|uniref:Endonuclease/exonuclease/phosphatase domain-containing protein n=1 Tax=Opisthorchis felineus TaxID=147828 RepID=A0A4S2MB45_OPIFE|nr:hypothetical protein CRM22_002304 [Opisthorchis felineus]
MKSKTGRRLFPMIVACEKLIEEECCTPYRFPDSCGTKTHPMETTVSSFTFPPLAHQGLSAWWTPLHPEYVKSAGCESCCTETTAVLGVSTASCPAVHKHSSSVADLTDELGGDFSSDEDVFLPDPLEFNRNCCVPSCPQQKSCPCDPNEESSRCVLYSSGSSQPDKHCSFTKSIAHSEEPISGGSPGLSDLSPEARCPPMSTGFADVICESVSDDGSGFVKSPPNTDHSSRYKLLSETASVSRNQWALPPGGSVNGRTQAHCATLDPETHPFSDSIRWGFFAQGCCCKPRLPQTPRLDRRCSSVSQASSSLLASVQPLNTLFRLLLLPPPKSVAAFSRLLQSLSPSLDLTPKSRLPWHTATRNKAVSRAFRGVGGEDFTKYMMLYERYNPPVGQVWSKSRSLAPLHRKAETTTAVPNVTSNCWLTPAEASRLKPKRRLSDGLLLTHIPASTSVELPESSNRSSTGTFTPGPKFSVVSAKNTKESSRDSSGNSNCRTATTASSLLPLFARRHSYATRAYAPSAFVPTTLHPSNLHRSIPPLPHHQAPYPNSFRAFTAPASSVVSYAWNYPQTSNLQMICPCCVPLEPSSKLQSSDAFSPGKDRASVYVDLTGFDVTVSVERLPPLRDTHNRNYPSHLPLSSFSGAPPVYRKAYSVEESDRTGPTPSFFSPPNKPTYYSPTTLPLSPPPPYSECGYPAPGSPHTASYGQAQSIENRAHCFPSTYSSTPSTWVSHAPASFALQPFLSRCQLCLSSQQALLNWRLLFLPCCSNLLSHCRSCSPPWEPDVARAFNFPSSTTKGYRCFQSAPSQHHQVATDLDCPLCVTLPSVNSPPPACCRPCCCCCCSSCSAYTAGARNASQSAFSITNSPSSCCSGDDSGAFMDLVPPNSFIRSFSSSAVPNYVYIPEPIRVSRSQDVYNALRTCLVPHYELREYFNTAPPQRQWRKLDELSKDGFPFTLMCYNLLSPNYATPNQYPYCPSWALNWDYRRRSILDEIRIYHANIICLQEVETNQFEEIFKPELEKLKYDAVFLPKSRRRTMDTKDGKKVDGCAIFWQTDKFEKLHEFHHEFMISCSNVCEKPTPLILDRVMTRDNVALGVIFETKGSTGVDGTGGRQFCVTTGHIHWDPEHSDVKMIQTILWTAELWAYIDQFLTGSVESLDRSSPTNSRSTPLSTRLPVPGPSSPAANMPVILCGDLNSLPESGVVEFLMRGSLPKTHNDFLNNGFKYMFEDWRLLEKWAVDGDTLRHRFAFDRAYRESQGMKLTNFTYEFKGMIDYVLYTRQHFRLLGSLDQIHESWFAERKIVGCPHVHFPSDHFALLVELELKPTPQVSGLVAARRSARNRSHSETASDPGQSKPNPSASSSPSSLAGGSTPYNRTRAESVGLESSSGGGGGSGSADGVTGFAVVHSGSSNSKQRKR